MPATVCIEILLNSAQHVNDLPAVIPGAPVISPPGGCDAAAPGTLDVSAGTLQEGLGAATSRSPGIPAMTLQEGYSAVMPGATVCERDPRSKVGLARPKVSRRRLVPPAPFQLVLRNRFEALARDELDEAEPFLAATKQQNIITQTDCKVAPNNVKTNM